MILYIEKTFVLNLEHGVAGRETQRLVVQCWNRGCHHANFSRLPLATRFLAAALKLLDACPELHNRRV